MADKTYTDDEKRTLRVLKMQEGDIARLQEQTQGEIRELSEMDKRLTALRKAIPLPLRKPIQRNAWTGARFHHGSHSR